MFQRKLLEVLFDGKLEADGQIRAQSKSFFGEFPSAVGSRTNPDGTTSFITIVPGMSGLEFVAGRRGDKRVLTLRDAQHEYVLEEK